MELTLFGDLSARIEARSLGRGKPVALLAYLSASPGRRASRERLATLLWSEGSSEQARQNLRQTLWYLKRRLGECVLATDDFVELAPEVHADRDAFLTAVRDQRLAEAVALYHGPFIPEFAAPGAAAFEEWVDVERRRLRALFVGCCDTLVRQSLSVGQSATAVQLARRARDEAPAELGAWRLLLEALSASHDVVSALAEAEHLEAHLAQQDVEPDDATRAALRAARAAAATPGGGTLGRDARAVRAEDDTSMMAPELIGREKEFRALLERWERAREGQGSAVLVTGVAGLGKSRLLGDLYRRLRASRARAVLLRANPGDRAVGSGFLAALAEAIAQRQGAAAVSGESASVLVALAPALASLYPLARPDLSAGEDATRRRVGALLDLLRAVSDEHPLAVLVDDIHWADTESRRVLDAVAARVESGRVFVVLAARPPIDALGGFAALRRVELSAFDLQRTAEFVARLGSLPAEEWAAEFAPQLLAASRGIPLNLIEALSRLLEAGAVQLLDGAWECAEPARVGSLLAQGMVLEARVRSLGESAKAQLLLLATLGRPLPVFVLRDETAALTELEHRGFVVRQSGQVQVAHDEIAAAAVGSASVDARREAHRQAAALLCEGSPSEPALVLAAEHARLGVDELRLRSVGRQWVRLRRQEGDGRSAHALVRELMGSEATAVERRAVLRSVPWWHRPARAVWRFAVVLLLVGALGGWRTLVLRGVQPDLELILRPVTGESRFLQVRIDNLLRWEAGEPIVAEEVRAERLPLRLDTLISPDVRALPDGSGWLASAFVDSVLGGEVFLVDGQGETNLFSPSPGDDGGADASPDGRRIVFATARYHPATDRYNLAMYDRATGRTSRLLESNEFDFQPLWSPDGSRIAFSRNSYTQVVPYHACVVHSDGHGLRCHVDEAGTGFFAVGWLDEDWLLVAELPRRTLALRHAETWERRPLAAVAAEFRIADPRVVAVLGLGQDDASSLQILRTDLAGAPRPVIADGVEVDAFPVLARARLRPRYVDRVAVAVPAGGVAVDQTFALRLEAFDASGQRMKVRATRFHSLDTTVAVVVDGVLHPRREGEVAIVGSVGGWRGDTALIRVVPSTAQPILAERWDGGFAPAWRAFGSPLARIQRDADGFSLVTNGDGKYPSGVYLTKELDPTAGIGIEFLVSAPISMPQWQDLALGFFQGAPLSAYEDWDHRTASGPREGNVHCAVAFGGEGGAAHVHWYLTAHGVASSHIPTPAGLYSGAWRRVRMQLFPDGRCGVALDGAPMMMSERGRALSGRVILRIAGHNVGTVIRVGPLDLWSGVRGGVDWNAARPRPIGAPPDTTG